MVGFIRDQTLNQSFIDSCEMNGQDCIDNRFLTLRSMPAASIVRIRLRIEIKVQETCHPSVSPSRASFPVLQPAVVVYMLDFKISARLFSLVVT